MLCLVLRCCVQLLATPGTVAHQAPLSKATLQARILVWVATPSSRGSSNQGIEPRSPSLQADSLPSESPGKLKNTGVGNLSLLQGNFPTQELNWCLLLCRQILYRLSQQGSPVKGYSKNKISFLGLCLYWYSCQKQVFYLEIR